MIRTASFLQRKQARFIVTVSGVWTGVAQSKPILGWGGAGCAGLAYVGCVRWNRHGAWSAAKAPLGNGLNFSYRRVQKFAPVEEHLMARLLVTWICDGNQVALGKVFHSFLPVPAIWGCGEIPELVKVRDTGSARRSRARS